jgi:putrescine transport system ATP-binding protein
MASRIAVMRAGKLEQIGTPAEIYARPASRFVAEFIGDINILEDDINGRDPPDAAHRAARSDRATATAVRPERISIQSDAGASANGIAGIVDDFAFRGSDTLYRVRLESGRVLRVVASNSSDRGPFRPGDKVRVQIPREACIPLLH